jgi:signal transduction histidine kinase
MRLATLLPTGLSRRFTLAAAGLAAGTMLVISLASWYLIEGYHDRALEELAARERQFHAHTVGSSLAAFAARLSETAGSTILATGLVDSTGKETYLMPFLNGLRQINGIPVQVLFTDFEGQEIASNATASFSPPQLQWLREHLEQEWAQPVSMLFPGDTGYELVAIQPLTYTRTPSPEGALLFKVAMSDFHVSDNMVLHWGDLAQGDRVPATPVVTPQIFEQLGFRISGAAPTATAYTSLLPPYLSLLLIALGLFSAVVLVGARLARLLTRDLHRLEEFSRRLIDIGMSQERAPRGGTAEVAGLALAINQMLDRLYEQHATLMREREKLMELAGALKATDRRKDEFLAMLAHELRNPLAPIRTAAALLARQSDVDVQVARAGEIIARQVKHMSKLVDDLLDVSRLTRGLVSLDRIPLDFLKVVAAALDQVGPLIESNQHRLTVRLPDQPVTVVGDHDRLVQIVSNLLTNAAKFTPRAGQITLSLDVDAPARQMRLAVEDNGNGIPPELLPEIFDLFTQGSRLADRSEGGLGLGLSLVKNLTELHDGTIHADSAGEGKGAKFTLQLPCIDAAGAMAGAGEPGAAADASAVTLRREPCDEKRRCNARAPVDLPPTRRTSSCGSVPR